MALYYQADLDITVVTPDWPLAGDPSLTWPSPVGTPDEIRVYRNTVANWAASTLIATLGAAAVTYTDGTAARDGTGYYYWVLAYKASGADELAGHGASVAVCQNLHSMTGRTIDNTTPQIIENFTFINTVQTTGKWRSTADISVSSWVAGNPAPPFSGPEVYISAGLGVLYSISGSETIQLVGSAGSPQPCDIASGAGSATQGEGDAFRFAPVAHSGTATVRQAIQESGPGNNWGTFVSAVASGVDSTVQLSYVSPAGGSNAPGQGSTGGATDLPPSPPPPPPVLTRTVLIPPLPTPLPCVPCCHTAAPICECRRPGQL